LAISFSARKYRASTTTRLHHLEALIGKNEAGNRLPREREVGRSSANHIEEGNTVRREADEEQKQELEAPARDTTGQIIRQRITRIGLSSFSASSGNLRILNPVWNELVGPPGFEPGTVRFLPGDSL
jgi:hypothetical protein